MNKTNQIYKVVCATCKVLLQVDWFGNYKINSISDKELQYIGEATNVEQYFKRFIEIIKDNVLTMLNGI